jgi:hypothetical protein
MEKGKFKIIDDGSNYGMGCRVFDPAGNEITHCVVSYSIQRRAGEQQVVVLELFKSEIEMDIPSDCVTIEKIITETTSLGDDTRSYAAVSKNGY